MLLYEGLSEKIVGGFIAVHNRPFNVFYKGEQVGEFYAVLAVEGRAITV